MHEIDRQAVPAGEAYRARRRRAGAPALGPLQPRPRRPASAPRRGRERRRPAQGRSGRQSSVFGSASPSPSHNSQGGSNRGERMRNGAQIAATPTARLAHGGAATNGPARRLATAMQWRMPKVMGSLGAKTRLPSSHQRRRAGDDREAAPEGPKVQPVAMGERQRNADENEERARHNVRQEPHLRRERQHRRG